MTYNEVFGGATLYPAGQTYLALTFSTDQTLFWPIEQQIAGNVVASIMDLNPTAAGLNVDLPDARQVSNGIQSVFNNIGGDTVTIRDATGGTIVSLGSGEAWVTYLTDNSTEAGTWRIFQLGVSVSSANASALAGAGLKAISSTLNQRVAPTSTAVTPITWTDSDRAQLTIWTGGVGVLDFPSPGTVGSDWFAMVRNSGSGDLTLTPPSGTIDGSATLGMSPGESSIIVTDGTNFFTVGYGQSSTSVFDFIEINVAGSGDYTLSGVELNRISYRFTGVLTGNRNIIVPNSVQQYWVDNSTSGAFSLFIKTAAQVTPIEVLQGDRNILYCDGTDVVDAESSTVTFPIAVAQGGTGATTAAAAAVNLSVPPDSRLINSGLGLGGGSDLTSDVTLTLSHLGIQDLIDPNADRILFWDDDAGNTDWLVVNTGLAIAGTDLNLSHLGIESLTDPGADRILFWDDGGGATGWLQAGSGLLLAGTVLTGDLVLDTTPQLGGNLDGQGLLAEDVGALYLADRAAAASPRTGEGQLWVHQDTPDSLRFSTDAAQHKLVWTPQVIKKTADEIVNNSSTLQDDNDFTSILLLSGDYMHIYVWFKVNQANSTPNFKVGITSAGGGSILRVGMKALNITASGNVYADANSSSQLSITCDAGTNIIVYEWMVEMNIGASDFKIQWAQDVAHASNTTVEQESYMWIQRIQDS